MAHVVGKLVKDKSLRSDWFAFSDAALGDAITGFEHALARYQHITTAHADYRAAEAEYASEMTEENQSRFFAAQEAYMALEESEATINGYGIESNKVHNL